MSEKPWKPDRKELKILWKDDTGYNRQKPRYTFLWNQSGTIQCCSKAPFCPSRKPFLATAASVGIYTTSSLSL